MRLRTRAALLALAASLPLVACDRAAADAPAEPRGARAAAAATSPAADRGADDPSSPQVRAVIAAKDAFKRALTAGDTATLARLWAEDYTFVNASGAVVTRAQRLANFASGATSVDVVDAEREVTVALYGDMAVMHTLATLRARYGGRPLDTDLRATLVWVRRGGRWQLATNQITPVVP